MPLYIYTDTTPSYAISYDISVKEVMQLKRDARSRGMSAEDWDRVISAIHDLRTPKH